MDAGRYILFAILLWASCSCTKIQEDRVVTTDHPVAEKREDIVIGSPDEMELSFIWGDEGFYSLSISSLGKTISGPPVTLDVFPLTLKDDEWIQSGYKEVTPDGSSVSCSAEITTKAGSVFLVEDTFTMDTQARTVLLSRKVSIKNAVPSDYAFNSFFMLGEKGEKQYDYFIPSLIYGDNSNLGTGAIGSDPSDNWILAREERMALPLAMMRERSSGVSIAFADYGRVPSTTNEDFGTGHLASGKFMFASLGFFKKDMVNELVYCYPGSEGEKTYSDGGSSSQKRWSRRSHPVNTLTNHEYSLQIQFSHKADFPSSIEEHWRSVFDLYDPAVVQTDPERLLEYGLEVLDHYWIKDNDAAGFPFDVYLSSGNVKDISFSMGFVGMQVACGWYMYRFGLENGNTNLARRGENILDFWANKSLNSFGMPKVWWDIAPWFSFRNSNDLRTMQGGIEAMIEAWATAQKFSPGSKKEWLDYCLRVADWLVGTQHEDGSWSKAFNNAGGVTDDGRFLTSNVIRFLHYMYSATGDTRYHESAKAAGEFCLEQINSKYRYVGSVVDNPNVLDRESGQKAMEAFLALYDLTGEKRWVGAAHKAAYYTASYMYSWDIARPEENVRMKWTSGRNTTGITIIATGHSGADCGISFSSFEFFRLFVLTGDEYMLRFAELAQHNSKQTMDYDGALGYPFRGFQNEALRLVTPWGDNVGVWLPWVTSSTIDPMMRLMDAYGNYDVSILAHQNVEVLKKLDERYSLNPLNLAD